MRVWLTAAVISAFAVVLVAWVRARGRRAQGFSFREWVRNPKLRDSVGEMFAMRDRALAHLSAMPPEALVELLLEDEFELPKRAIEKAGPRVVPALLAALEDPRFHVKTTPEAKARASWLCSRSSPLVTLLYCLGHHAPAEALPRVAPLVRDDDRDIRKAAARLIGAIGTDECIEPLEVCCRDEDDWVRSSAMGGAAYAVHLGQATEGFRTGAYRAILPLLYRRDSTTSGDAPCALMRLNREAAIEVMTRPENLVAGVEGLQYVLRELERAEVAVDEGALLSLIESLEGRVGEYPNEWVVAAALRLLARATSSSADATLRRCAESGSERVRVRALECIAARAGIIKPYDYAWDQREAHEWDGVTSPQRNVLAVREYIDEYNNGGIEQYFVNSTGNHWRLAEAGLRAIGSKDELRVLLHSVGKFGGRGPSENADERRHQLAKVVTEGGDRVFWDPAPPPAEARESIETLLWLYILAHPDDFRPPRQ